MSRWFRFYDEALDDEKVQLLSDVHFRAWVNLLCLASKNNGVLPPLKAIAFRLRKSEDDVSEILNHFFTHQLLDLVELDDAPITYSPHNWNKRQYKSDDSKERVKQHRKRQRNGECNVTSAVTVTPPETDTETDTDNSEANASGAVAPRDFRAELFDRGLKVLGQLTGKGPDSCRSFVGKCLKAANDDAVVVLGLIEDAQRNRVADPSAWIAARLKSTGPPGRPLTEFQRKQAETNDVRAHLRNLGSGGGRSGSAVGILPDDHGERPEAVRDGAGSTVRVVSGRAG